MQTNIPTTSETENFHLFTKFLGLEECKAENDSPQKSRILSLIANASPLKESNNLGYENFYKTCDVKPLDFANQEKINTVEFCNAITPINIDYSLDTKLEHSYKDDEITVCKTGDDSYLCFLGPVGQNRLERILFVDWKMCKFFIKASLDPEINAPIYFDNFGQFLRGFLQNNFSRKQISETHFDFSKVINSKGEPLIFDRNVAKSVALSKSSKKFYTN